MKYSLPFLALGVLTTMQLAPFAGAEDTPSADLARDVREREERVNKMTLEEQLKLRAAQVKATQDPAVKEATVKRDAAIKEFRAVVRASMIKDDPTIEPLLDRVRGSAAE